MITKDELLMGRDETFKDQYTQQISDNIDHLLDVMNIVRAEYGRPMRVTSGWRPATVNKSTAGAAPNSAHMTGEAVDISDGSGALRLWVLDNLELLTDLGLFMEDFNWTPNWVHFGIRKPGSGKRIFVPQKGLPPVNVWDGRYDSKYDAKRAK